MGVVAHHTHRFWGLGMESWDGGPLFRILATIVVGLLYFLQIQALGRALPNRTSQG